MVSAKTQLKAETLAILLSQIAGSKPKVEYSETQAIISFDSSQKEKLKKYLDLQLQDTTGESDVKINFEPVVFPILIKKIWPYVAGLFLIGYVSGKIKK